MAQDCKPTSKLLSGSLADLEELSSTTTRTPESDVSSAAFSVASTKLGRLIEQLKGLKCGSPGASPKANSTMGCAYGSAKGDSDAVLTIDSDDEPSGDTGTSPEVAPPHGLSRSERVAQILKSAKQKRLQKEDSSKGNTCPTNEKENPHVLPDHVARFHTTCWTRDFYFKVPGTTHFQSWFSYLKGNVFFHWRTKVVKTIQKLQDAPKPFALKDTYVPAVEAARAAADDQGSEPSAEDNDDEIPVPPKGRKRKNLDLAPDGKPWDYAGVRSAFLKQQRDEKGLKFQAAKLLWDQSDTKRNYLKDVSLQELKRRKFVPKGATTNPWAD